MQTFLPFPSYAYSAHVLDQKRLGKQRVECKQILNALTVSTAGWKNHPATRMWRGHEAALTCYGIAVCREWRLRGYNDSLLPFFFDMKDVVLPRSSLRLPPWIGDDDFHLSHQSNLMRKDAEWYGKWFSSIPDNLPYVWPV